MEVLLALYNIQTVRFIDNSEIERHYFFDDKMLAENIFIEYYAADPVDTDEDEIIGGNISSDF